MHSNLYSRIFTKFFFPFSGGFSCINFTSLFFNTQARFQHECSEKLCFNGRDENPLTVWKILRCSNYWQEKPLTAINGYLIRCNFYMQQACNIACYYRVNNTCWDITNIYLDNILIMKICIEIMFCNFCHCFRFIVLYSPKKIYLFILLT